MRIPVWTGGRERRSFLEDPGTSILGRRRSFLEDFGEGGSGSGRSTRNSIQEIDRVLRDSERVLRDSERVLSGTVYSIYLEKIIFGLLCKVKAANNEIKV